MSNTNTTWTTIQSDGKLWVGSILTHILPAFEQFPLGAIRKRLENVGFQDVEVQDLSQNVTPMMRFFFLLAYIPYLIIQLLGLEAHFVNTMAAVELWRYSD